ncbi:GRP family sugar transporter [Nicoliella spurrieriana]|uniref:GRP family sugar transporter n=1 Tax=Nicoliella spurrieriana TaxID=2925830 RepID=A0A976RSE1_9LACO|nr:GRP family sugar transporter [Nicoliella spurrieriana]UQS86933.1 GRP family sugar transporter [Nicoliella spurrieriana]
MDILIGLIPALLWGVTPLWVHFLGGKPIQQLLGTTYGALIVGIVVWIVMKPDITISDFLWCFVGGFGWSLGQLSQYNAFRKLGVSTTTPIVTGLQLVGVNIVGVLFLGSWQSGFAKMVGFSAVILVVIGVVLTTRTGNGSASPTSKREFTKNLIQLIIGSGVGYTACSTFPKVTGASGWTTFPSQSVGMFAAAVLFSLVIKEFRDQKPLFDHTTLRNIFTGISSGIGTAGYLVSITLNGVSTGFTLSQMCVVVSTFGGIVILHEHKVGKSLVYTVCGVALVLVGGIMTSFIR